MYNMINTHTVFERCKKARQIRKMSVEEVAKKIPCSVSALRAYEGGQRKISMPLLNTFAWIYDVDIMYLLGFADNFKGASGDDWERLKRGFMRFKPEEIDKFFKVLNAVFDDKFE